MAEVRHSMVFTKLCIHDFNKSTEAAQECLLAPLLMGACAMLVRGAPIKAPMKSFQVEDSSSIGIKALLRAQNGQANMEYMST